jgi:hypothetical protein
MKQQIEPKGKRLEEFWKALSPAIKRLSEKEILKKENVS